jgi:uncharacterized protein YyaL (SSP411 family)
MLDFPTGFSKMLAGLDLLLNPGREVVLFLPRPGAEADAMARVVQDCADECATVVVVPRAEPDPATARLIPLTRERRAVETKPTAYVCSGFVCHEPVFDADSLRTLLAEEPAERRGEIDTAGNE